MTQAVEPRRIPYEEHRIIGRLLRAHVDAYAQRLRAVVAFGDLVGSGQTYDIDLVEVVEGWKAPEMGRLARFENSSELPLRGQLRVYFLAPEEFEDPRVIDDDADRGWVEDLLERVARRCEIVMEIPPGYARRILERRWDASTLASPPSGYVSTVDPLRAAG